MKVAEQRREMPSSTRIPKMSSPNLSRRTPPAKRAPASASSALCAKDHARLSISVNASLNFPATHVGLSCGSSHSVADVYAATMVYVKPNSAGRMDASSSTMRCCTMTRSSHRELHQQRLHLSERPEVQNLTKKELDQLHTVAIRIRPNQATHYSATFR